MIQQQNLTIKANVVSSKILKRTQRIMIKKSLKSLKKQSEAKESSFHCFE